MAADGRSPNIAFTAPTVIGLAVRGRDSMLEETVPTMRWSMSAERQKDALRRYFREVVNEGRLEVINELFAPGGRGDAAMHAVASLRSALPDLQMTIEDLVAEGDRVVVRVICEATHSRPFLGIQPTGRRIRFDGAELAIFDADDRILREGWHVMDTGAVYRQLGVSASERA